MITIKPAGQSKTIQMPNNFTIEPQALHVLEHEPLHLVVEALQGLVAEEKFRHTNIDYRMNVYGAGTPDPQRRMTWHIHTEDHDNKDNSRHGSGVTFYEAYSGYRFFDHKPQWYIVAAAKDTTDDDVYEITGVRLIYCKHTIEAHAKIARSKDEWIEDGPFNNTHEALTNFISSTTNDPHTGALLYRIYPD